MTKYFGSIIIYVKVEIVLTLTAYKLIEKIILKLPQKLVLLAGNFTLFCNIQNKYMLIVE